METIGIKRNQNEVEIKPDFGKRVLITFLNGRKKFGFKLNKKNQFVSRADKIGFQLTPGQADLIQKWEKEFNASREREDNRKIERIKNLPVRTLSFKYGSYFLERYMHTEYVSTKEYMYVYSEEGEKIMAALRSFSKEQLQGVGIKPLDGVWQTIELSKEDKTFIVEQGVRNLEKERKKADKERKEKEKRKAAVDQAAAEMVNLAHEEAVRTGEKQSLGSISTLGNDGNLIIGTKYIHPDGSISHEEYHDDDL